METMLFGYAKQYGSIGVLFSVMFVIVYKMITGIIKKKLSEIEKINDTIKELSDDLAKVKKTHEDQINLCSNRWGNYLNKKEVETDYIKKEIHDVKYQQIIEKFDDMNKKLDDMMKMFIRMMKGGKDD